MPPSLCRVDRPERVLIGRPAEEMPRITPNLCGPSRISHNMAAVKALDDLYGVEPPPAARLIRELEFNAVHIEDASRFFLDNFGSTIVPSDARLPHIPGILGRVGKDLGLKALDVRKKNRRIMIHLFGKASHPEGGLPGGVSRGIGEQDRDWIREAAAASLEFFRFAVERFKDAVLADKSYFNAMMDDADRLRTCSMAMVDEHGEAAVLDGRLRIVDPDGRESAEFSPGDYARYIGEWEDPGSAAVLTYVKPLGLPQMIEGQGTSIYRVGALARLNAAVAMQTSLARKEADFLVATLGGRPVNRIPANHWARLICGLQAAERNVIIADDPLLVSKDIRNMNLRLRGRGVGAVESPNGTVIHDYETDERGVVTKAQIIGPDLNNAAALGLYIGKIAAYFVSGADVKEGFSDRVVKILRLYDPGIAYHLAPGKAPLSVIIRNSRGEVIRELNR